MAQSSYGGVRRSDRLRKTGKRSGSLLTRRLRLEPLEDRRLLSTGGLAMWSSSPAVNSTGASFAARAATAIPVLSIDDVAVSEGNSGTKTFTFTVSITGANELAVSVDYATADGTAEAGTEYVAASGTLNWSAGDNTAKTISVVVNGNTTVEADKTFFVNLSSPSNATLSDTQGVGTIVNDDLSIASVVVAEAGATKNGTLEPNEGLKITWGTTSAAALASQVMSVDGRLIAPINGPYGGVYYSCPIGTWAVGSHSYTIQAADSKGISSTSTGTFTVVDPPDSAPTIGQVVVSQTKGKISWNVVDPDGVASSTLQLDGALVSNVAGPFAAASGVNFSAPLGQLSAGSHAYVVTATDKLGNQSTSSGTFTVASQGPTISQVTVSQTKGRISWNALSSNGVANSTLKIDGTSVLDVVGPFAAPSGVNFSASLPALAVGDHTYTISATDGAGNTSTSSATFTIGNTTSGPTIGQVAVSEAKARISWNAAGANGVANSTVVIDGAPATKVSGPFAAPSGVNFSAPLGQLAAGSHAYTITAIDKFGNVSTLNGTFTLINPTAVGPAISQVTVSQTKRRISWNALDIDGVRNTTLELDGLTVAGIAGPFAAPTGVNFSASLGSLAAGNHTYRITATDGSGNVSTLSGSFVLVP
jgi:hypothetical protein